MHARYALVDDHKRHPISADASPQPDHPSARRGWLGWRATLDHAIASSGLQG
jgi:hypothetical protein